MVISYYIYHAQSSQRIFKTYQNRSGLKCEILSSGVPFLRNIKLQKSTLFAIVDDHSGAQILYEGPC